MPEYEVSEEECVEMGGHCFEESYMMLTSFPPKKKRVCKHCGKTQMGVPQDRYEWVDSGLSGGNSEELNLLENEGVDVHD